MEPQDRTGACPHVNGNGGRAQGKPGVGTRDLIGAALWSDHDPYTDEALLDPWPGYKQLRDAGPAVWLPRYEMFALTRYDSVRRASFRAEAGTRLGERPSPTLSIGFSGPATRSGPPGKPTISKRCHHASALCATPRSATFTSHNTAQRIRRLLDVQALRLSGA
jgi:hypothetical protein